MEHLEVASGLDDHDCQLGGAGEEVTATDIPSGARSVRRFLRGLALCITLAIAATWLSEHYAMPAILIALLLGLALNFAALDKRAHAGLDLAAQGGLRAGIVLIGLQITLSQIAEIGLAPFLALLAIMTFSFASGVLCARISGQSTNAGVLAGGATAVCGASAALALYSIIGKDRISQAQFALTLLCVALASAAAMTIYPIIAAQLALDDRAAGFLIGAAVHDVAQAIGGGYSYSDAAGAEATIIKLTRVALLAPIVLLVSLWLGGSHQRGEGSRLRQLAPPWFILGFLGLAIVNSLAPVPPLVSQTASAVTKVLLLLAVTATALRSRTDLIQQLGWRAAIPVAGATLASLVSAVVFTLLIMR